MSSLDALREEIRSVFQIFDENGSGFISLSECVRVLYIITGERLLRSEVRRLISSMQSEIAQEVQKVMDVNKSANDTSKGEKGTLSDEVVANASVLDTVVGSNDVANESWRQNLLRSASLSLGDSRGAKDERNRSVEHENVDEVSIDVFENVVLHKLNARSFEKELIYVFTDLEDPERPGYITKKSLARACVSSRESLTDFEIDEMFDPCVTKVPSAEIDFTTFSNIISTAKEQVESQSAIV